LLAVVCNRRVGIQSNTGEWREERGK